MGSVHDTGDRSHLQVVVSTFDIESAIRDSRGVLPIPAAVDRVLALEAVTVIESRSRVIKDCASWASKPPRLVRDLVHVIARVPIPNPRRRWQRRRS